MNKHLIKAITAGMSIFIIALLFPACGGKPAATPLPATKTPASPTPPPVTAPAPPKVDPSVVRAKGEQLYQKTAGGMGCQACHGADGKGGNLGPDIRGKSGDDIKRALGGDAMSFIRLPDDDIEAVAAYLKYLQSQP